MPDPSGVRRRSTLRQEAGVTLHYFLGTVAPYNPPNKAKHFAPQFRALYGKKKTSRLLHPERLAQLPLVNPEAYRQLVEDQLSNEAFFNILVALASKQEPSQADLNRLRNGLNREIEKVGFFPGRVSPAGGGPYMPAKLDAIRAGSELLLRYLNLAYHYGAAHTVCVNCKSLMTTGRGGKKFCSPECRRQSWSYTNRAEYFKRKQKQRTRYKKTKARRGSVPTNCS